VPLAKADLDITALVAIHAALDFHQVQVVINAAAYTAVDKAETDIDQAYAINEQGPKNLALACQSRQIPLIHLSTDFVFDGRKRSPYLETDETHPLNVYGASKLAGENQVLSTCGRALVVRTAWVFSEYGKNFLKTVLRLAEERKTLTIVQDQCGSPTYAYDIASFVLAMAEKATKRQVSGLYHFAGPVATNWCDFAKKIINTAASEGLLRSVPEVVPIRADQYPLPARRPSYSVLDCSRALSECDLDYFGYEAGIRTVVHTLIKDRD